MRLIVAIVSSTMSIHIAEGSDAPLIASRVMATMHRQHKVRLNYW
jgi:hypothetical protein